MGNYIQLEDLQERLGSSLLSQLTGEDPENTILQGIMERAEAMVDSYASLSFHTPLPPGGAVKEWTLRIAEYELHKRSPMASVPEKIRESYIEALTILNDLAAGKVTPSPNAVSGRKSGGLSLTVQEREEFLPFF